jgi:hypothetical protein
MKRPIVQLTALHLIGNAALLWLGYTWLGAGESDLRALLLSIAMVLIFLLGGVWLHGTSLAYFREPTAGLRTALGRSARRLLPLILLALIVGSLYLSLRLWDPGPLLLKIASAGTMLFQKPVRPDWLLRAYEVKRWLIQWCVLPVFLLPMASGIAGRGWSGWGEFRAQWRNGWYWLAAPLLLLAGVWLPLWLAKWTPVMGSFGQEMTSLVMRLGAGYLLFVGACLALAFVTSRGKPAVSQPSTVPSP